MTNDNLNPKVRLPLGRRGTIIRVHEPQGDTPPVYDVEADHGQIITMVAISEGSLIPKDDYDRVVAMVHGVRDGTAKTVEVTDWTADQFRKWILGES